MSSVTVIENKISVILRYVSFLKENRSHSLREIERNLMLRGAIERYLYLYDVLQNKITDIEAFTKAIKKKLS